MTYQDFLHKPSYHSGSAAPNEAVIQSVLAAEDATCCEISEITEFALKCFATKQTIDAVFARRKDQCHNEYLPYWDALHTRFGALIRDHQLVIPKPLRRQTLKLLHSSAHIGTTRMRELANSFWWPGIEADIERWVADCPRCLQAGKNLKTSLPSTEKILYQISQKNQVLKIK